MPAYTDYPQSGNIQGYWKLNEESGERADSGPNGNDLTDNNTVLYNSDFLAGTKCADFEASNSEYLSITDGAQTGLNFSSAMTVCAWVKAESYPTTDNIIFGRDYSGSRSYYFYVNSSGKVGLAVFKTGGGYTLLEGTNTTISTGAWYHIACTYEYVTDGSSKMNVYVNGVADVAEVTNAIGQIHDNGREVRVGAREHATVEGYWDGLIDEVIVWNTCLTAAEILAVKNITAYSYGGGGGGGVGIGSPWIFIQDALDKGKKYFKKKGLYLPENRLFKPEVVI